MKNKIVNNKSICDVNEQKKLAGYMSIDQFVKPGMTIGLGSGSTAFFALERLAQVEKYYFFNASLSISEFIYLYIYLETR